jgi:hypothetical protein
LQDLYVLGDLPKAQYVMHRQAIEEELQRLGAPADPGIERAKELLGDFSSFWELETEPAERRRLLVSLFAQVWAQEGRIVAVQPHEDFLPYFQAASRCRKQGIRRGAESGSDGGLDPRCTHPSEQPAIVSGASPRPRRHRRLREDDAGAPALGLLMTQLVPILGVWISHLRSRLSSLLRMRAATTSMLPIFRACTPKAILWTKRRQTPKRRLLSTWKGCAKTVSRLILG